MKLKNDFITAPSLSQRRARMGFLFAVPGLLFFIFFYLYPILETIRISFHRWGLLDQPRFIGLSNYQQLFADPEFINSVYVTLTYVFATCIPIWFVALGLALIFNESFRFRQGFLTIYYIPAVISLTVWSLIWFLMYNPTYGLTAYVTDALNMGNVRFLDAQLAMLAMVLLSVWKGTPVYMIIYLAGLRSIPGDYYEAAKVDGANKWQRFWHITLPQLRPVLLYVAVISIIEAFKVFTPMYIITRGGPGSATRVLPVFIFENGFQFLKMGYASAASVIFLLMLILLSAVQFRLLRSQADDE
ncbi:MAG: sugar ABC transporter permease [Anaerolineae bacterium]|jgi:multiple sugar transport system permease protein|nr:sugar ABC transporter permease [Anaerolineae bacterium]